MICTDSGSGSVSENTVYSQDEVYNRITTSAACEGVSEGTCGINNITVPCIWQLICTDSCSGSVPDYAIYSQDEVNYRVTTSAAGEGVSVGTGSIDDITAPCVRQLVCTDGCPGGISENAIYC